MNKPASIAVNVMVKNAKSSVLHALQSIAASVDEIVVFDTGSTDGTQQAVREYFDQLPDTLTKTLREVPWIDDFAAIRNQMLDATESDWVFALDADETVTIAERNLRDLTTTGHQVYFIEKRSYVKQRASSGFHVLRNEYPELERGYIGYISEPNYLFFRKLPTIRYERLIHETIENTLTRHRTPSVRINHVVIHNYGRHDMSSKGSWYRSLIEKLVAQSPQDSMAWFYLAAHEKADGNLARAEECCNRSLALLPQYSAAKFLKAQCLLAADRPAEAEPLLVELKNAHPKEEDIWLHLLRVAAQRAEATQEVTRYISEAEASGNTTAFLYETAAEYLAEMKKPVKAQMYLKKARELRKKD